MTGERTLERSPCVQCAQEDRGLTKVNSLLMGKQGGSRCVTRVSRAAGAVTDMAP